jgi:hypothetical protein
MLTANNFLIMPLYAARIMNLNWWHYLRRLLPIILATLGVAIASYALTLLFPSPSLFSLLLMGFSISCVYLIITYRFGLSGDERDMVVDILGRIFSDLPGQKRDRNGLNPPELSKKPTNQDQPNAGTDESS